MHKGYIDKHQLTVLVTLMIMGSYFLVVPRTMAYFAGSAGWLGVVVGSLGGVIVGSLVVALHRRFPSHDLMGMSEVVLGKWLGKLWSLLFFLYTLDRHHNDAGLGCLKGDQFGSRNPIDFRHIDIHQDDIRLKVFDGYNRLSPVLRLPDDLNMVVKPAEFVHIFPRRRRIVDDEQSNFRRDQPSHSVSPLAETGDSELPETPVQPRGATHPASDTLAPGSSPRR